MWIRVCSWLRRHLSALTGMTELRSLTIMRVEPQVWGVIKCG